MGVYGSRRGSGGSGQGFQGSQGIMRQLLPFLYSMYQTQGADKRRELDRLYDQRRQDVALMQPVMAAWAADPTLSQEAFKHQLDLLRPLVGGQGAQNVLDNLTFDAIQMPEQARTERGIQGIRELGDQYVLGPSSQGRAAVQNAMRQYGLGDMSDQLTVLPSTQIGGAATSPRLPTPQPEGMPGQEAPAEPPQLMLPGAPSQTDLTTTELPPEFAESSAAQELFRAFQERRTAAETAEGVRQGQVETDAGIRERLARETAARNARVRAGFERETDRLNWVNRRAYDIEAEKREATRLAEQGPPSELPYDTNIDEGVSTYFSPTTALSSPQYIQIIGREKPIVLPVGWLGTIYANKAGQVLGFSRPQALTPAEKVAFQVEHEVDEVPTIDSEWPWLLGYMPSASTPAASPER